METSCLQRKNIFYFDLPCDKIGDVICKDYEFLQNGKCLDKCATIRCSSGQMCTKGICVPIDDCKGLCKDYERCFQGKCQDKCNFLRCANCYKGKCGVIKPPAPVD